MKDTNRTKEQILDQMNEAMPFNLSENHKPYILEAMEIYAQQQVKNCLIADVGGNEVAFCKKCDTSKHLSDDGQWCTNCGTLLTK